MLNQKVLFSLMSLLVYQDILGNEAIEYGSETTVNIYRSTSITQSSQCSVGQTIIDLERDVIFDHIDILKLETDLTGMTLNATLNLSDVPDTLPFNRLGVPVNALEYGWSVIIDIDNNSQTGDPENGAEYQLSANHFVFPGSTPIQLPIGQGVQVNSWEYNGDGWSYLFRATLSVDDVSNKLVLIGDIPGISSNSQILFETYDFNPGGALQRDVSSNSSCGSTKVNRAYLESPSEDSFESGIGLIRGWVCQANTVEVQIDGGEKQRVAYGTTRKDTIEVCGDANNGFGYTFNWNALSTGTHTLQAFADNLEFANVTFNVTTLGVDYLRGASGEYTLPDFPQAGNSVTVRWAEPHQNFVIVGASQNPASAQSTEVMPLASPLANLESPQQGSFESGIGLIRGWVCQANTVEVQIDGGEKQRVAYGTTRKDTIEVCGDADNGFGYTFNWNALSTGTHRLQAFADNLEFANVTFNVTTLGVDYLREASGTYTLSNFPIPNQNIVVRWQESNQNFCDQ